MNPTRIVVVLCVSVLFSCKGKGKVDNTLFTLMDNTNIHFENNLTESKDFNVFTYRNFYNGGGAAIGDLNNDGLPDVFFTSNQGANKLYFNKGNFKFEDVSEKAGFKEKQQWSTGVVLVDINNDGWLDIYLCNAGNMFKPDLQRNQLFINNHDGTFTENAAQYNLDAMGYTTHASFFDYDMDGDLDCFIVDNSPIPVNTLNYANMRDLPAKDWKVADFLKGGGDHLYRNDEGKFVEVSKEAGIHGSLISLGLGVTVGDVNGDGYLDVYVSNDFFERDYLYINQRNGTFKDELEERLQHISLASMGADMQDVNNDGYPDIFTTDMLPADDYRLKTTTSFDNYDVYKLKEQSGFYHQYMQNTLQLNNKSGKFMEIGNYSGVDASDWSWGGFFFDADNDGFNDLYVCNGIAHDVTDQDFIDFFASTIIQNMIISGKKDDIDSIIKKMPSTPLKNKVFKNQGDLRFKDIGDAWGFTKPSFSNGAAYGDLDNDGDLDLIVNNVNGPAFVYRNNSETQLKNNYIAFRLKGKSKNTFAIGSMIKVYADSNIFSRELIPSRGFQSSMDYELVIGLGKLTKIDSVQIIWPNRTITTADTFKINKINIVSQPDHVLPFVPHAEMIATLFRPVPTSFDKHQEDDYVDFYNERNIPKKLSKEGPRAAVADVNGDGRDDVFICGSNEQGGQLYLQTNSGSFIKKDEKAFKKFSSSEDVVCLFFDADGDKSPDLFVGSGGNNRVPNSKELQHQLYRNDGHGNFTADTTAFPSNGVNVGAVAAYDFDKDGDADLFVGGRSVSYLYGFIPKSYIFINDGKGHFKELTPEKNGDLSHIGMVTGATWADVSGDNEKELIITGEWIAPRIFNYAGDHFQEIKTNMDSLFGWWQTVEVADLDGDGKNDIILGNVGENCYLRPDGSHPVKLYSSNFGMSGNPDKILTYTDQGRDMPVFLKHNLEEQFPYLKKQNLRHEVFAKKPIGELFGEEQMKSAVVKQFNFCSSVIAWNLGNGQFKVEELPQYIQFSSLNAVLCSDVNNDGRLDIVTGGNEFGFPPQMERLDANPGFVMINLGNRKFKVLEPRETGIELTGQVRDIQALHSKDKKRVLFLRNSDYPALFEISGSSEHKNQ